jgi:hypothetical protein
VIAPTGPCGLVACGEQCVDLLVGQVRDQRLVGPFRRDREHPGDAGGVFGMLERREPEQGVDRSQPDVTGPDAVTPIGFKVVEESSDYRCVEVGDVQT